MARSCSKSVSSASSSLTDALRGVLLDPAEAAALPVHGRIAAAVLVALYVEDAQLHAIFTRRRSDLRSHPGEISFPGGRRDEGEHLSLTALREAEEEIGLPRDDVRLLGALTPVGTIATDYAVYPFVGMIEAGATWTPSAREVDEVLELRLEDLRAARTRRRLVHRGIPIRTDVYDIGEQLVIWGATARIVGDLLARVGPCTWTEPPHRGAMDRDGLLRSLATRVHDERVLAALAEVPRELFVARALAAAAYNDAPLRIGHGQTISQPAVVARMCELLELSRWIACSTSAPDRATTPPSCRGCASACGASSCTSSSRCGRPARCGARASTTSRS